MYHKTLLNIINSVGISELPVYCAVGAFIVSRINIFIAELLQYGIIFKKFYGVLNFNVVYSVER